MTCPRGRTARRRERPCRPSLPVADGLPVFDWSFDPMITSRRGRAAASLIPLALAACASAPPAPLPAGHPALPGTAPAAVAPLTVLQSYRDFAAASAAPDSATPRTEKHDAHEH
jgi:hypothetical protein